jgi:hypothetical protein
VIKQCALLGNWFTGYWLLLSTNDYTVTTIYYSFTTYYITLGLVPCRLCHCTHVAKLWALIMRALLLAHRLSVDCFAIDWKRCNSNLTVMAGSGIVLLLPSMWTLLQYFHDFKILMFMFHKCHVTSHNVLLDVIEVLRCLIGYQSDTLLRTYIQ